jgi:hypothetical protein
MTILAGGNLVSALEGTLSSDAITLEGALLRITTEAKTTAAHLAEDLVITNALITAKSIVLCIVHNYIGAGDPSITRVNCAAGAATCVLLNNSATALDAAVVFDFIYLGEAA